MDINILKEGVRCVSFLSAPEFYSKEIKPLRLNGICKFYAIFLFIYYLRDKDLGKVFNLDIESDRLQFIAWCVLSGASEYKAIKQLECFWQELSLPAKLKETEWSGGISRLIQICAIGRKDLNIGDDLSCEISQFKLVSWYWFGGGLKEVGGAVIPRWQKSYYINSVEIQKTRFAKLLLSCRSDLQRAFDTDTASGLEDFKRWLLSFGIKETPLVSFLSKTPGAWPKKASTATSQYKFGVNLIGYAFGELGIGEDVRMAARALDAAGVPFLIINFAPGANISQGDKSVQEWIETEPKYFFNIFCLTAIETFRFYCENGSEIFDGRYNIGYWPWELPRWPEKWRHCFSLVDEVWASSSYIKDSLKASCPTPMPVMPMAVELPTGLSWTNVREHRSLSNSDIVFIFSFDGGSHIKRKNPLAIVKAFKQAFPEANDVCLIVKCMRPDESTYEWKEIVKIAKCDSRIRIIDETLPKKEVLELYGACDCYVSLHRSEGYGRGIAEAFLLGLDVIATGFSGNVDFCSTLGAHLVDYKLIKLGADDYVESENQFWADPDINSAVTKMVDVYKIQKANGNKPTEKKIAAEKFFSLEAIGNNYKASLEKIFSFNGLVE